MAEAAQEIERASGHVVMVAIDFCYCTLCSSFFFVLCWARRMYVQTVRWRRSDYSLDLNKSNEQSLDVGVDLALTTRQVRLSLYSTGPGTGAQVETATLEEQ